MTRDEILKKIVELTDAANGVPPGKITFARKTGLSEGFWSGRYWARWSDAVKEAGFEPNILNPALSSELFFGILHLLAEPMVEFQRMQSCGCTLERTSILQVTIAL